MLAFQHNRHTVVKIFVKNFHAEACAFDGKSWKFTRDYVHYVCANA